MKSTEERIAELEQRVAYLEDQIKSSEREKTKVEKFIIEKPEIETSTALSEKPIMETSTAEKALAETTLAETQGTVTSGIVNAISLQEEVKGKEPFAFAQNQPEAGKKQADGQGSGRKDKEALVGKYIIGALAAMLIFVGAISFIGLLWNRLTPEIKLLIISSAGIILSASGFWLIRAKKNPITSIILGTGAGLLFISILSANLAFHLIGNTTSILLAGIWAVFFIISSRYTNLFFTTIIAYIGGYITLLLGLMLMQGDAELYMLILFTSGISAVMIYTSLKQKKIILITGILLTLVSYTTILNGCYIDGLFGTKQVLNSCIGQIAIGLIIYLLMNVFYKIINNTNAIPIYLGVSAIITIHTGIFIGYLSYSYLHLKLITCFVLFFIINLIQFMLNNVFYEKIEKWLTRYYAVVLVFAAILINTEWYQEPTGIILIGLLLVVCEKVFKRENQSLLLGLIVLMDSLFLILLASDNLICSVYGLLQLGVMAYVLRKSINLKKYEQINFLKIIGIVVIIINSFAIPSNIVNYINVPNISEYVDKAAGYLIAVAAFITLSKAGYFKDWKSETFKFFGSNSISENDTLDNDKVMQVLNYLLSTGLYFYGLRQIANADRAFLQLLFTMATIAVTLLQSKTILSGNGRNKPLAGIWIVLKYLILTWTILWGFLDLDILSVIYSIAGLIVAIVCISAGFKLKIRNIRLYGLVLTIIMVAKFILVDLNQENSIIRVLALVAGGGLCFLISFIYNKLSENFS